MATPHPGNGVFELHDASDGAVVVASAVAVEAAAEAAGLEPPRKKRKGGRRRDEIWKETTVCADKTVLCNRCHAVIHRYGTTKVERVRAHFANKCLHSKRGKHGGGPAVGAAGSGATATVAGDGKARKTDYVSKNGLFKRKFAHWLYATGQLFDDVESGGFLLGALRVLRADAVLPSRAELENELLELEFNASLAKVHKALNGQPCCLTVESWADATGKTVKTFGAVRDGASYYLESTPTDDGADSGGSGAVSLSSGASGTIAVAADGGGELAFEVVEAVLSKHKKGVFQGVVTPTTAVLSRGTRDKLQKKHPQCVFFHGCVCHALRLLMSDMTSVLPWLEAVSASVLELVRVFHGHHKLQHQLRSLRPSDGEATLLPASSSLCASLESVLTLEKELYTVVARRDFVESSSPPEQAKLKRVQDFVLGETFVQDLVNALAILRPLQQHLTHFERARASVSQVLPYFVELLDVYAGMEWVNKKDKALITSCVNERLNAIYGDTHGVAYLLDPLYLGANLDAVKLRDAEAFIARYCRSQTKNRDADVDVLAQFAKYREMVAELKECNAGYWELLTSGAVRPSDFWGERRQFPQLQQLALAVFDLPVASTSPSVSFGAHGLLVHARFHTALPADKVQKLAHVYCNAKSWAGGDDAGSGETDTELGAPALLMQDI